MQQASDRLFGRKRRVVREGTAKRTLEIGALGFEVVLALLLLQL
jgi:hypothetical protein